MGGCFDFGRFAAVVRWDLTSCWRRRFSMFAGFTLLMFVAFMFTTDSGGRWWSGDHAANAKHFLMVMVAIGSGLWNIELRTKQQRTTLFMLPATPLEKFNARLLHYTLGVLVICVAAVAAADVLHYLSCLALGWADGQHSMFVAFVERVAADCRDTFVHGSKLGVGGLVMFVDTCVCYVWVLSLIWLISIVSRKGMVVAVGLLVLVVLVAFFMLVSSIYDYMDRVVAFYFGMGLFLLLTVINYWLSYRLFCRMQIVPGRWFNG